ncbi:MAG: tetrahydromethanopterin S-methyltransferase subunit A [Candidatus Bathyarchaeota archaeon]
MSGEVKKCEPAEGWPILSGDYVVGNPKGCIAICTLASETLYRDVANFSGVAISGPCKTENIGIEKVVANTLSNPNIRFLIICGAEVTGHVTGGTLKCLSEKGIDPSSKKVRDAPGAIPYVEHLSEEVVERFKKQITIIDMIGVEDVGKIKAKVEELVKQDPGAYPEAPYILKIAEEKVEEVAARVEIPLAPFISPAMTSLSSLVDDIKYKVQLIGRERRITTAVSNERGKGLVLGLILSLIFLLILLTTGLVV